MAAPPPEPAPPLLRNVLVPVSLVACFGLVYWARLPLGVAVLAVSPLLVLFAIAPTWALASTRAYDRDVLRLRAAGRSRELRARFGRALGMRLFAAPAITAERLGDVLRELGDPVGARLAYRRALEGAGAAPTLQTLLGLAHAAYASNEDSEAIGAYRRLLEIDHEIPRVRARLAHALLRRGGGLDSQDARELLDTVRPTSAEERDELTLLRAYADAREGRADAARAALRALEGGDEALRAEVESVLASRAPSSGSKKKKR